MIAAATLLADLRKLTAELEADLHEQCADGSDNAQRLTAEYDAAQRQSFGRTAPPDEHVRALLAALGERGGKLTRAAIGQKLGLPPVRVPGFVSGARKLLNVDGYDVLGVDEASDTVALNVEWLRTQFEI